jgi:hypothetical protein
VGAVIGQDDLGAGEEVGATLISNERKCAARFELTCRATPIA